jgi:hypothetical protein
MDHNLTHYQIMETSNYFMSKNILSLSNWMMSCDYDVCMHMLQMSTIKVEGSTQMWLTWVEKKYFLQLN